MKGYLTPDSIPAGYTCRVLFIPDDRDWIAQVYGAVEALTYDYSWTEYGSVTPAEAAAIMGDMFDKFVTNVRGCNMIGEIILWSGGAAPNDTMLLCDGSTYAREDYPDLYSAIAAAFHVDADSFNVPDLRNRVPVGSGDDYSIGDTGGEAQHTLIVSEMPTHGHTDTGHVHALAGEFPGLALAPGELPVDVPGSGEFTAIGNASITDTGGSGAHNNLQPYLALAYYIQAL